MVTILKNVKLRIRVKREGKNDMGCSVKRKKEIRRIKHIKDYYKKHPSKSRKRKRK